ncbi:MAG: Ada metal-binding domain-containing protein, partial [Acidobacteriaceae bacterium]
MATIQVVPTTAKAVEMKASFDAPFDGERAWLQVQTRDASVDGQFVYAVETTGIFC